jgi:hypothetical protein
MQKSDRETWNQLLDRIIELMERRKAAEAVIFTMNEEREGQFHPFQPGDKEPAAEFYAATYTIGGDLIAIAVVLILGIVGNRTISEFYPLIQGDSGWSDHDQRQVIQRAVELVRHETSKVEGGLISMAQPGEN